MGMNKSEGVFLVLRSFCSRIKNYGVAWSNHGDWMNNDEHEDLKRHVMILG